jgi:hypothetical protein
MALGDVIQTAANSSGSSPVDAAFGSPMTAGNMILVVAFSTNTEVDTLTSITDSRGNTYTRVPFISPSNVLTERCYLYVAVNTTAGANTVRVNFSANGMIVRCLEVESDMLTNPLDVSAIGSANGANPSISLAGVAASAFVCGIFAGVNSVTAGAGFTSDFAGNSWNFELVEHKLSGAGGAVAVAASMGSGRWTGVAASFLLTSGGGGGGGRVVGLL